MVSSTLHIGNVLENVVVVNGRLISLDPDKMMVNFQLDSMLEQNQQLQLKLDQALLAHERAQETMSQREAQVWSDFRAMMTEFERKQAEWAEERCIDMEKGEVALREKQKESDAKWAAWVKQLKDEQAKKQNEASYDYVQCIAELDQQCMQQDEWYVKMQWRLHVSQTSVQSTTLYQCHGNPSVSLHVPPPPQLVLQQLPPVPSPCMPARAPQVSQLRGHSLPHHCIIH